MNAPLTNKLVVKRCSFVPSPVLVLDQVGTGFSNKTAWGKLSQSTKAISKYKMEKIGNVISSGAGNLTKPARLEFPAFHEK